MRGSDRLECEQFYFSGWAGCRGLQRDAGASPMPVKLGTVHVAPRYLLA